MEQHWFSHTKFWLSNFARYFSVVSLSPQVELYLVGDSKMIQLVSFKIVYSCVKEESYKHHLYWCLLNSRIPTPLWKWNNFLHYHKGAFFSDSASFTSFLVHELICAPSWNACLCLCTLINLEKLNTKPQSFLAFLPGSECLQIFAGSSLVYQYQKVDLQMGYSLCF